MTKLTALNIEVSNIDVANEIIAKMNTTHFEQVDRIAALEAEKQELIAALEAITERAEDVSQKIPVENRNEGVSQATHVRHMAGHLEQHAKIARRVLAEVTR